MNKIRSFSHGEFNENTLDKSIIESKILKSEDIFNRGFKLKKIEIDKTFPNFILENKEKYLKWII